jgi:Family of unknown function (DUF5819)
MGRLEASENGRVLISTFVLLLLICIVTTTLPLFGVSRALTRPAQPVLAVTALAQNWSLFAPDPRRDQVRLEVRLRYPDGSTWTWRPPHLDPVVGHLRDYHWQKWTEDVVAGLDSRLGPGAARYAASVAPRPGATRAQVIRRTRRLRGPGQPPGPWRAQRETVTLGPSR